VDTQATISRDGSGIAFTAFEQTFNVETLPLDAEAGRVTGDVKALTAGRNNVDRVMLSPDGRSVTYANDGRIWRLDPGQSAYALTSDRAFQDGQPRWSPDGRSIAFDRTPAGDPTATAIWVMAADGASPRALIEKARAPYWTPDSKGITYGSYTDGHLHLFDIATRRSRRVTDEPTQAPLHVTSPDGKWIVYQSSADPTTSIHARALEGGPTRVIVATPHQSNGHPMVSPSGNWLYYQADHKNVYRVPGPAQGWRKAEPEKLTSFPESGLFIEDPRLSMDGKQLVYCRGKITGDLWLLRFGEPGPKK
jgi:Tol biopolymer transport system component